MDADWSHDPAALPSIVGPIDRDEADLVIGSRYTRGGGVVDGNGRPARGERNAGQHGDGS